MADDQFDFRSDVDALRLRAEALGEPGQRRFRLLALLNDETYIIWMEKQQLQALGLALEQLLEQLPDRGPELEPANVPVDFDLESRLQFRVGRMELGYDDRRDRVVIVAHDIEQEDEQATPSFGCRITRAQARDLSADSAAIVAAGRPRCSMCGAPMGPGPHVCPQQNGHYPLSLTDAEPEVDEP